MADIRNGTGSTRRLTVMEMIAGIATAGAAAFFLGWHTCRSPADNPNPATSGTRGRYGITPFPINSRLSSLRRLGHGPGDASLPPPLSSWPLVFPR